MGIETGCDLHGLMDAADDLVRPLQDRPVRVDRESLSLGYRRRLFELPAPCGERRRNSMASTRATSSTELGRRRMVGGQEDMIVDVALDILKQREAESAAA